MRISVFGLGYVGCITAACLAHEGHDVIGVDINAAKVRALQEGLSPLIEPGLDDLITAATTLQRLHATQEIEYAVLATDVSLICVGTPSSPNGSLDSRSVLRVCQQIGEALQRKSTYHVVALRSTVLPDVLRECQGVLSTAAGKAIGFVANPEFLREGTGVHDFYHPPLTVIGQIDDRSGDRIAQLYRDLPGTLIRTDPDTAMLVKYASNVFHALKITFANEIGRLCATAHVDAQQVMNIFCQDTTLNISTRYLKPGFAFGGSCLPKDLRAVVHQARHSDQTLPVIEAILPSNQLQLQAAVDAIVGSQRHHIGLIGLAFKPDTDDLRESPLVQLAETLLGKGYQLKIYDEQVHPANLVGSNRVYIQNTLPHLAALMDESIEEVIAASDIIVIGHAQRTKVCEAIAHGMDGRLVIDLAHELPAMIDEAPYVETTVASVT